MARKFSPWSHLTSLLYGQLSHALSLNDICDALQLNEGALRTIRGATPPMKNTFSHANRERDPVLAEKIFWGVYQHLNHQSPGFGRKAHGGARGLWRFKRTVHIVDSTVIQLVANSMDWAKHRRRKAAAKCHMRLDMQSLLPRFAIVAKAAKGDQSRARELCAGLREGEIVIMDRGYLDFRHLAELAGRGVFFVARGKENLAYRRQRRLSAPHGRVLADEEIVLTDPNTKKHAPKRLRRVEALVEVDGQEMVMVFLTNNFAWAASSVADLYRGRWQIEVFFKQIKQTLQLSDFYGYNEKAVRWQVWTALLTYLLLRYAAFLGEWSHAFSRLWAVVRSALWHRFNLIDLLKSYGTAKGSFRCRAQPEQAYFPSFG